jgi:hypothetical protein
LVIGFCGWNLRGTDVSEHQGVQHCERYRNGAKHVSPVADKQVRESFILNAKTFGNLNICNPTHAIAKRDDYNHIDWEDIKMLC